VVVHAVVSALHGWAHLRLRVALSPFQAAFVAVVITAGPIVAAALLWTDRRVVGAWLLLVTMAASLAFGVYYHYIAISSDHVAHLPAGSWRGAFRWTAALLIPSELAGALVGALALRAAGRP
jgi:hypothetical protein